MKVIIGWGYTNAVYYCQLMEWDPREVLIILHPDLLRAIPEDSEVILLGPETNHYPRHLYQRYVDWLNYYGEYRQVRYDDTDRIVHPEWYQ